MPSIQIIVVGFAVFQIKDRDFQKLVLPSTYAANPCDNDGVLSDSEPHIQACILGGVAHVCGLEALTEAQMNLARSTFGQPDNMMSQDLFDKISTDEILGRSETLQTLDRNSFVEYFIEARRAVWEKWTSEGRIETKPFALDYLNELRTSERLFGLVTGMPFDIAAESVKHILKAEDILPLTRERRVCCDDIRLEGRGKPDPLCYDLAVDHFIEKFDISPQDMWVIEDRANGAVAALSAGCKNVTSKYFGQKIGKVIVIPDANDGVPLKLWDKKLFMENLLANNPEDLKRLYFLRSLEDLSFSK